MKLREESGEIRFNENFPSIGQRIDGEMTVNNIIMIFVQMEYFKEVKLKYRVRSEIIEII